jgi:hypothetical protein
VSLLIVNALRLGFVFKQRDREQELFRVCLRTLKCGMPGKPLPEALPL